MKKIALALIGISLLSCSDKKASAVETEKTSDSIVKYVPPEIIDRKQLIIPGKSIGLTQLGQNAETLSSLEKPDFSDAAMGKAWATWYSKDGQKKELNIYTTYKNSEMKEKVIRQIRITSPEFKTSEGIAIGKSLNDIQKGFPKVKIVGEYNANGKAVQLYDDADSGIAFEIENDLCIGIIIHEMGKKVTEEYITLHPDMERF
ncbi:hypothetical protein MH928_11680 [Flavobacterium sp. WW92]|uniref:hypothetical protein n=1 Tax=unclassified Flavobacterium TaxID=196869 RepID=UPI0022246046|nr:MULTISPECIES: hypothetical protein [unclassified Flavobacterium]WDO11987.1 hypothetical protein MH928_11680 [Flavobacterium sp. WW92]